MDSDGCLVLGKSVTAGNLLLLMCWCCEEKLITFWTLVEHCYSLVDSDCH
jgi:hypothetical protein